jgi:hemerythrin-like domain-containing protein
MSISIPGYEAPRAGFEAPLEMLGACHARIERNCGTLRRLVPHLAANGSDTAARTAAANLMRYFDTAARDHHADEEDDLFPALIESMAGSDAVCIRELTARLCAEHRELEARWDGLRAVLERVVAGEPVLLEASEVEAMVGLYERHLEREDSELLPMAERLLSDAELDRVGRAMRERRGIADQDLS